MGNNEDLCAGDIARLLSAIYGIRHDAVDKALGYLFNQSTTRYPPAPRIPVLATAHPDLPVLPESMVTRTRYVEEDDFRHDGLQQINRFDITLKSRPRGVLGEQPQFLNLESFADRTNTAVNFRDLAWGVGAISVQRRADLDIFSHHRESNFDRRFVSNDMSYEFELRALPSSYDPVTSPFSATTRHPFCNKHRDAMALTTRPILELMKAKKRAPELLPSMVAQSLYTEDTDLHRVDVSLAIDYYVFTREHREALHHIARFGGLNYRGLYWAVDSHSMDDLQYQSLTTGRFELRGLGAPSRNLVTESFGNSQ